MLYVHCTQCTVFAVRYFSSTIAILSYIVCIVNMFYKCRKGNYWWSPRNLTKQIDISDKID